MGLGGIIGSAQHNGRFQHPLNPSASILEDGTYLRVYDAEYRLLARITRRIFINALIIMLRVAEEMLAGIIIIDGEVGTGKTSLAVQLADALSGERVNLRERMVMSGNELMKQAVRVADGKNAKVIIYDEAGDFSNRGFLDRFNKNLMRFWEQYRALRTPIIMTLPSALLLDKGIYDLRLPRMFIHLTNKRQGVSVTARVYSFKRFMSVKNLSKRMVIPEQAYRYIHPNFHADILPLPEERQRELDSLSLKRKKENLTADSIKTQGYRTLYELAYEFGVSYLTVRDYAVKLGLEPDLVYQRRRYYRPEDVERLRSFLRGIKKK